MLNQLSETQVQQGERLLQQSWLRIVDNMQGFSAVVDRSGTILYRNRTPASPAVLIGSKIYDAVRPEDRDAMRRALRRVLQTREVRLCEVVSRFSGACYRARLVPIVGDAQVVAVFVGAADISEQRRVEEDQWASEKRLRTLIANAPVVLFAIDGEGVFTIVEGRGLSGLGLRPGENVGRSVFDVYRDVPEVIDAARRALGGESFTFTLELAALTFHAHYGPLRDRHGRVCGGIAVGTDITERKRAEEALRASEERWRSLVQNSPDVIMNVARDGTLVLINRTLPGFPLPEQMVGASVYEFIPPQDHDTMREALDRAFQTGEPDGFEIAGSGPHRTISYYACRLAPVEYDGQVASVNLIATDVTERKRAEEALWESEERFRRLSEVTLEGIVIHDGERILDANPQAAAMHGCELSEFIGMDLFGFLAPDCHDLVRQQILSGHVGSHEVRGLRKDGTSFPMEICGKTVSYSYEDRQVRVGIVRDITERRRAEEALRESENSFRTLSEASFEGIAIHDKGTIVDGNQAFASMFGYELSEAIGMHVLDFVAPESRDPVSHNIVSKYQEPFEFTGLRKDGTTFPVEVCGRAIPYQGKMVTVAALRDLTERMQAEAALQEAREQLEARVERQMERGNSYGLTFRELTVLHLMAAGQADKEIAFHLGISPRTASKHVENILRKMGVASRTEASVRTLRAGLVGDRAEAVPFPLGSQQTLGDYPKADPQ